MTRLCLGCMEQYNREYDICPYCGYVAGTEAEESIHMEPGTTLEGRYVIGKVLGYGGFGVTYIGWDRKLEQKVAIKEYLPSEFCTRMPDQTRVTVFSGDKKEQFDEGLGKFIEEGKRLSKFQNEAGIVKIFDSFKSNATAYLIMEYLEGETLSAYLERIGNVSEEQMLELLSPVMKSLQVVHEAGILHRDISPDNLYVTKSGTVKLIDFGASRYATTSHSRSLTVIIKPGYSPEEQYRSRGDQGSHTDLYALAAVMYKMLTGITPPDALERRAMIETKKKDLLKDIHKVQKGISPEVENAILNAMNVQIEDRTPTLLAFMDELYSKEPVKRRYGKIKKLDVYAWPTWLKITLGSTLAAVVITALLLVTGVIDFPSLFSGNALEQEGMVQVPNLEGMGTEEAIAAIEKLGLQALASGNVESGYIEAGKIVLQKPAASEYIQKGGIVRLTVSSGTGVQGPVNGIATMPYVVWNTKEEAISKLGQAGLGAPVIEEAYDSNVEAGKVISQGAQANEKLAIGTKITLVVSKGIVVVVPNVVGKTEEDAIQTLKWAGLETQIVEKQYHDSVEKGRIITQDVQKGEVVLKGTTIRLTVSMGAEPKLQYVIDGDHVVITKQPTSLSGHVVIPDEIERLPVTGISSHAFYNCRELTSIELPNGLQSIGDYAFSWCESLTSIKIPEGVKSIGDYAFEECASLTSIELPSGLQNLGSGTFKQCRSLTYIELPNGVTSISNNVFSWCTSLTSIKIPEGVKSIDFDAFYYCASLTSIELPDSVTSIGDWVFHGCESLTSIELPSGLQSLGRGTFENCTSLTYINLPKGMTSIEYGAFQGCTSLTSIELPNGVTSIGESAFYGCWSLKDIELPDSVISIGDYAFYLCYDLQTVYFASEAQKQQFASCFESKVQLIVKQ